MTRWCHVNYVHCVMCIMSAASQSDCVVAEAVRHCGAGIFGTKRVFMTGNLLAMDYSVYIIQLTHMKRSNPNRVIDGKTEALRQQGALHPKPEAVQDEAFRQSEFFDPRDQVQVRYEMLRRHRVDGQAVTEVSAAFGVKPSGVLHHGNRV